MKITRLICDHCETAGEEGSNAFVTNVEVTYGGNGADRRTRGNKDLCRNCYSQLVQAIHTATEPRREQPNEKQR